ncbi:4-hydroxythreonine-4-phosphate dehydrogenase PdxA [Leptolyngbya sp. FACHB-261]|uniref:4-hydroxythreonine-4-phosphate dehydrogenase PdxA n=1 Tax=Leptolyngbya sp. FACHB-261 TaxID=2692806 RepID=UPI0016837BC1|nr:4-hydroxythreonine-4-phosphate dehydrogenase PdxA [Leptolyngbya sp. FACHB-261]MBD2099285.1 4-hydroxythreonine-4-phosphate dehydrogenase PdxA [Leptolyngbya sp. FACHB-261]
MLSTSHLPKLALTLGDPAGIGPEVVLKALAHLPSNCRLTVVGERHVLEQAYTQLRRQTETPLAEPDAIELLELDTGTQITPGSGNAQSGRASFDYLKEAILRTMAGEFDGVVTAPIAKSAWKAAGHHYPGQTELLAQLSGAERFGMLFVARSPHTGWLLRTLLVTTHIPLAQVPSTLNPDLIHRKLDLLWHCLQTDFGLSQAQIAVAGLNPHSGEDGQLGSEERDWLRSALTDWQAQNPAVNLSGPVPPDTLWVKPGQAWFQPGCSAHDAYLALYHDQGLIPVKLMAFDRAVNTTIGLPFVRTSPDHGTAFDIVGRGIADPTSLLEAIALAASLTALRQRSLV